MNVNLLVKTIAITAALFASIAQGAYSKTGTIKALDLTQNSLVLDTGNDEQSYQIPNDIAVSFMGVDGYRLSSLETGQRVKLKFAKSTQFKSTSLKGEVISVDHNSMTAQIKVQGSNRIETVRFAKNVSIQGVENFTALQAGHLVTVR